MNTSDTHDHEDEIQIFKNIKNHALESSKLLIKLYYLKTQMRESTGTNEEISIWEKLPTIVLENILQMFSHKTLFDFASEYPEFVYEILNPIYWKFIKIDLSETLFNHIDILTIIMYLNTNLRHLSFIGNTMGISKERLSLYFDYTPNLIYLELGRVTDFTLDFMKTITQKLKNLVYLSLCWNSKIMRDDHLKELLQLKYLHSVDLSQCVFLTDSAVLEFVKNVKKLVYFNIDGIEYINDE
jgi:hypothetical protein